MTGNACKRMSATRPHVIINPPEIRLQEREPCL